MADDKNTEYQPVRQYLISEKQVRAAFVLSFAGMVGLLLLLLVVAMARPQARYELASGGGQEYRAGRAASSARLEGYEVFPDGTARIDIDRAMELVVARGVANPGIVGHGHGPGAATVAGEGSADAQEVDGAAIYVGCAACHQANGRGLPSVFPPLAGHAADLYEASRDYLIDVVLYGLMGRITVDGVAYDSAMPSHSYLSDAEIAAVLNHVLTAWGEEPAGFAPYAAADVAAQRGRSLRQADVFELRRALALE
jgi:mono/diheme cytochrome c family protein